MIPFNKKNCISENCQSQKLNIRSKSGFIIIKQHSSSWTAFSFSLTESLCFSWINSVSGFIYRCSLWSPWELLKAVKNKGSKRVFHFYRVSKQPRSHSWHDPHSCVEGQKKFIKRGFWILKKFLLKILTYKSFSCRCCSRSRSGSSGPNSTSASPDRGGSDSSGSVLSSWVLNKGSPTAPLLKLPVLSSCGTGLTISCRCVWRHIHASVWFGRQLWYIINKRFSRSISSTKKKHSCRLHL